MAGKGSVSAGKACGSRRTLDQVLVKEDLVELARRLNVPIPRRPLEIIDLREPSVVEQVLHNKQVHLGRLVGLARIPVLARSLPGKLVAAEDLGEQGRTLQAKLLS